jgi:perosamine synthetase
MNTSNKIYSYGKQSIDEEDIQSVVEVLKSDWLTQGPKIQELEEALCKKFNSKYGAVVSNGTAGLHLIGLALGWKKDDIIITSPITFVASANCAVYAGATPDFVDINSTSYTIDVNKLESRIKTLISSGKKVKAVVAVDYAGHPCDWEGLKSLSDKYEFQLVNDYCHALGAEYKNDFSYAVKYANAVNLSFHPVKHITSGEGGAVLTNSREIDTKIKILRTHGITKDPGLMEKDDGPWYYEMQLLGFNYRITDFQCALGLSQLKKLDSFIKRRREIAKFYDEKFKGDDRFVIPKVSENVKHAYHLYPLQIKFDSLPMTKKEFFARMKENRIILQVHYIPVHLMPYYRNHFGFKEGSFPIAEEFYKNEISLPIYPALENEDLQYIVERLK